MNLKKLLIFSLCKLFFTFPIFSQVIAEDFTLTDVNGITHNLYDELDEGKTVIIDFFSLTCGSCQTGIVLLEEFWQEYNLEDENLSVWAIEIYNEGDEVTNDFVNYYNGTFTVFSMPNGNDSILENFNINYTPRYISVCPNKYVKKSDIYDIENLYFYCKDSSYEERINDDLEKIQNISFKENKLNFILNLKKNRNLEINLFNSMGQKVLSDKKSFLKGKNFFQFSDNFLKKSFFILQISENKKVIERKKVLIF